MTVDALEMELVVESDGSGVVELTVNDERLEERVQLLRTRGATREGDTWRLPVGDVGEITGLPGHLLALVADMLNPPSGPGANRFVAIERDGNRCRLCGRDFDAVGESGHESERVVDHVYPRREAGPEHGVHEPANLVTVCRGCDDVFLQGDAFRFVPRQLDTTLTPLERQLLAWVQKRAVVRSDWLVHRIEPHHEGRLDHDIVVERLRTFSRLGVLRELADVAPDNEFDVFCVDYTHTAVCCLDKAAVHRHTRLPPALLERRPTDDRLLSMSERKTPVKPASQTSMRGNA